MFYLVKRNKTVEEKILYHIHSKYFMQKIKQIGQTNSLNVYKHKTVWSSFTKKKMDTSI